MPLNFPDKLVYVEVPSQVPMLNCLRDEVLDEAGPFAFHRKNVSPYRSVEVVQFEHRGRDRTSTGEPGPRGPSEQVVRQGLETRVAFGRVHGGHHHGLS